jgi:hypothetical protein
MAPIRATRSREAAGLGVSSTTFWLRRWIEQSIAEDLDLDVARPEDRLLEVDGVVAEELLRLAAGALPGARHLVGVGDEAHALAAAAGRRLEHDREADLLGRGDRLVGRLAARAGDDGHARGGHLVARGRLAAHRAHRRRGRPDERDARALAGLGQRRVLAQEAVAGVDGLGAGLLGGVDDLVDPQVALARGGRPDGERLVGHADVEGGAVGLGVHGDRADPHLAQRAHDADGDLAAVGYQDFAEGAGHRERRVTAPSSVRKPASGRRARPACRWPPVGLRSVA